MPFSSLIINYKLSIDVDRPFEPHASKTIYINCIFPFESSDSLILHRREVARKWARALRAICPLCRQRETVHACHAYICKMHMRAQIISRSRSQWSRGHASMPKSANREIESPGRVAQISTSHDNGAREPRKKCIVWSMAQTNGKERSGTQREESRDRAARRRWSEEERDRRTEKTEGRERGRRDKDDVRSSRGRARDRPEK